MHVQNTKKRPAAACDADRTDGRRKEPLRRLLLHSCCAPCSSHVLEILSVEFAVTVFFFNPNIYPAVEYAKRRDEQRRLISKADYQNPVLFIEDGYSPELFSKAARGLESCGEGESRCEKCFELRLMHTAKAAKNLDMELFATTLTVSPKKDAVLINAIGESCANVCGVGWLSGNFKKGKGFERSVALSKKYGLYRQNYCGCEFSLRERTVGNG